MKSRHRHWSRVLALVQLDLLLAPLLDMRMMRRAPIARLQILARQDRLALVIRGRRDMTQPEPPPGLNTLRRYKPIHVGEEAVRLLAVNRIVADKHLLLRHPE